MADETMRVWRIEEYGGEFREVVVERPVPGKGQVLVRIHASGVNPLDTKIRAGKAGHAAQPLPAVLGLDMAGVVEAVGEGVTGFRAGDAVYGMVGGVGGQQGTLAEFVAADANLLAHKPARLSMREAAALPLVAITAWEGLVDRAHVQAGQKVLIHAGAGGVGHLCVQLARAYGAEVFATVSEEKRRIVEGFGATAIDYRTMAVDAYVAKYTGGEGFDIAYDTVGDATLDACFLAVKRLTGHAVSCLGRGTHSLAPLSLRGATYSGVFTLMPLLTGYGRAHHGEILEAVARLADEGKITPLVNERRFGTGEIAAAHSVVVAGANGKVVVELLDF
jgi:NADPH2:quinone reductase